MVNSAVPPEGSISFSEDSAPIASCQDVVLVGSAPPTATCTVSYPTPGVHSVEADYSGDSSSTASTSASMTVTVMPTLVITTTSTGPGTVGTPYPATSVSATGGISPYTWSVTSGPLPPGLSLDAGDGEISGIPTAGTYPFTVEVTDSEMVPVSVTDALSITVSPSATTTVIAASQPQVVVGQSETYTATVASPVGPTGVVDFSQDGSPVAACQGLSVTTTSPYTATCTVTYTTVGTHSVTASYGGDASTTASSTLDAASVREWTRHSVSVQEPFPPVPPVVPTWG